MKAVSGFAGKEAGEEYTDSQMTDRILGCLKGLACGDAIGKQTEGLSRDRIRRWYPDGVRGFEGTPGDVIPRYASTSKHRWRFGETTDDTERTIGVARAVVRDERVRHASVGLEMLACTKCVHPGVRSLWEFHQANDPQRVTSEHDGCGAAIRVSPVGIVYRSHRLDELIDGAREASIPTHGGPLALAAAAATAVAISAAIDGADAGRIFELAQLSAARAERERTGSTASTFAAALIRIRDALLRQPRIDPDEVAAKHFPDNPFTIVPLALALATLMQSTRTAILLATNVGGDSDSVASIAGAVLGARYPETVAGDWYDVVEAINDHRLVSLGESLGRLRH